MQVYKVGGAIRDELLGIKNNDTDYVVVGSTIEEMLELGYQPVGGDFPVFLHPTTREAYALARSEKKNGIGYKGFVFYTNQNITIEEDLKRRDITINAIAKDIHGNFIDPYGGIADIKNKIIRHVSDAFSEDPLRILRVARFASRFKFDIAPETLVLMKEVANHPNELASLSPERIQMELVKAIQQCEITQFFSILNACGALNKILTEFKILCTNSKLSNQIKLYLETYNQLGNKKEVNSKLVLIYYAILHEFNIEERELKLQNSLLNTHAKKLLKLIFNTYPFLSYFDILLENKNISLILDLFNLIDPLRKNQRYIQFKDIIKIISLGNNSEVINHAINFINKINMLFCNIDYKTILANKNNENIKNIVYNIKLDIILKLIQDYENAPNRTDS